MKLPTSILLLLSLLTPVLTTPTPSLHDFEQSYLNTFSYSLPNITIKLIGYKKIIMSPTELSDLEHAIATRPSEWASITSAHYDPVERAMRVYFPVQRALVRHKGELVEASDLGELEHERIEGDCAVVGRYQTEEVRGVRNNRVEGGLIWLREESQVVRRYGEGGNLHVYDFGWRHGMHSHEHGEDGALVRRKDGDGGSCFQNHGGRVCSIVYGINEGRCTRPKGTIKECIDYNGWPFKNCKNHSDKKAFPMSDCFVAVARGHCWNEVEDALHGDK
ncbi:hypothetical protein B0T14DRAFT_140816 [Immersiella caudata]|uniref:Uncharacterized protein n=1 Tax=Immersiella caudata TaxID=314043 RepID=A0AA39X5G2_9PEZI|nr:hypothetical protein B0T14DRAFT_140816 [Immersiella caudata]